MRRVIEFIFELCSIVSDILNVSWIVFFIFNGKFSDTIFLLFIMFNRYLNYMFIKCDYLKYFEFNELH